MEPILTNNSISLNPLMEIILQEIKQTGPIPFSRYMELSLYHPQWGYYEQTANNIGSKGDFITSITTTPLFSHLLTEQLLAWSISFKWEKPWIWIESGAHDGTLANDILEYLSSRGLTENVLYYIIEPSDKRRKWQEVKLKSYSNIRWYSSIEHLPSSIRGILFCNELLDAFPCNLFEYDAHKNLWYELYISSHDEIYRPVELIWQRSPNPTPLPTELQSINCKYFQDGYKIEHSSLSAEWWRKAAKSIHQGIMLTFDYGIRDSELEEGFKPMSTIRAIAKHQYQDNWLSKPGKIDLSSAVHWDEIIRTGEESGMQTSKLTTQEQFLMRIIQFLQNQNRIQLSTAPSLNTQSKDPIIINPSELKTLIHPQYFGHSFQTLVQTKN